MVKKRTVLATIAFVAVAIAIVVPVVVLTNKNKSNESEAPSTALTTSTNTTSTTSNSTNNVNNTPLLGWHDDVVWYGRAADDAAGGSLDVDLSNNAVALRGDVLAFGAPGATNGVLPHAGAVRTRVRDDDGAWGSRSPPLSGSDADRRFGTALALSGDGTAMVVGAPGPGRGRARVYDRYVSSGAWLQRGSDLDDDDDAKTLGTGFNVALSADGRIVALGSRDGQGERTGRVRVYTDDKNNDSTEWRQLGNDIDGEQTDSSDGRSVSLSASGLILAVGGPHYNGEYDDDDGRVRVLKFNADQNDWTLLGNVLPGPKNSLFGFSVDLAADGRTLAVGGRWHGEAGIRAGGVFVYRYHNKNDLWLSVGDPLLGDGPLDQFGTSVRLSSDGKTVAAGALGSKVGANSPWTRGNYVKVYRYAVGVTWAQLGDTVRGKETGDRAGESIALSSDGNTLVVGASFAKNDKGVKTGSVRVLSYR